MPKARTGIFAVLFLSFLALPFPHASAEDRLLDPITASMESYIPLPAPGKKVPIGSDYYFIYDFNRTPRPGMIVMKVEVFTADGKQDTSLEVLADAGMPSMKGAHEMGEQRFEVSRSGNYFLPINIVMPGDWEIRLTIRKNGKVMLRGRHAFTA